ncbi:hypothetical protein C8J57DRAFT_1716595 [Mycena rebaudengoi]|nr:hypothetical protein C8J57DRAFT_1716595 [Mycena rebaudengoi]
MGALFLIFHIAIGWWCIAARGVLQNFTVEDTDSSVRYLLPSSGENDRNVFPVSPEVADEEFCSNRACTACSIASPTRVELIFTGLGIWTGSALYVAIAVDTGPMLSVIQIDDFIFQHHSEVPPFIRSHIIDGFLGPSIIFYHNDTLASTDHVVTIDVQSRRFDFDYFIYTADRDPVASASSASGSTTRINSVGPSSTPRTNSADPSSTSSTNSGDPTNQTNPSRTNKKKIGVGPIVGGVIAAVVVLALAAGIILWRNRRKTSGIPIGDSENGSPTSAPIKPHTDVEPAPSLEEKMRQLQAKVERLEANTTSAASVSAAPGSSVTRSLSTMKTEQTLALYQGHRVYSEASRVRDVLAETDRGLHLMAEGIDNPPPPVYHAD